MQQENMQLLVKETLVKFHLRMGGIAQWRYLENNER